MTTQGAHPIPQWRTINITPTERIGRVVLGVAVIVAGIALIAAAGPWWAVALELLLVAAGADLLITGAIGHCPLYQKLGYTPRSLRNPS